MCTQMTVKERRALAKQRRSTKTKANKPNDDPIDGEKSVNALIFVSPVSLYLLTSEYARR